MKRQQTFVAALLTTSCLAVSTPAFAQEEGQTEAEDIPESNTIVVTATRRGEDIQDVPIAISAFSGDDVDKLNVANLQDLTNFIPSAELFDDRGGGMPTWVIRGVGLADFNSNNTPAAAIFDDDVYLGSNVLGGLGLFDLERIEVLKGPQGGMYGRNTTGGAVRYIVRTPNVGEEFNGSFRASYGSWGRIQGEGAIGGPLGENGGFRLAVLTDQGGGWQDSLATPLVDDKHGDRAFTSVRGQLSFEPDDRSSIRLKVNYGVDKSETTLMLSRAAYDLSTANDPFPSPCADAIAGNPNPQNCVSWYNITSQFLTGAPGLLVTEQESSGKVVLSNPINELDNEWLGGGLYISHDFDNFTLTLITAYQDFDGGQVFDYDGTPSTFFHENTTSLFESFSQEIRLVSTDSGPLEWAVGANFSKFDLDESRNGDLSEHLLFFPIRAIRSFNQEETQWSAFAQGAYDISDTLSFNGSVRYTDEEKNLNGYTNTVISDPFNVLVANDGDIFVGPQDFDYNLGANWSGHVGIDFKPTDLTLFYGKIVRGYKSGGFFGGFALDPGELAPYDEETVWAYEVGFKADFPDQGIQMSGAGFYYDYQDVQGFTTVEDPNFGSLTKLDNLGDAEHIGTELEISWSPPAIEGLTLQAAGAWLDAEIVDSDTISVSTLSTFFEGDDPSEPAIAAPIEGAKRQFAPKFSYSLSGQYEHPVSDDLTASVGLQWSWRDDQINENSLNGVVPFEAGLRRYEAYGVLSGRVSVESMDGWSLAVIGQNLTNDDFIAGATQDDLLNYSQVPGRPRSFTVELKYEF